MTFIPFVKTQFGRKGMSSNTNAVRIAFYKSKKGNTLAHISFTQDIAKTLGIKHGDTMNIAINDQSPLVWFICKDPKGWTVTDVSMRSKKIRTPYFVVSKTWKGAIPELPKKSNTVKWDYYNGGVRFALPAKQEDGSFCENIDLTKYE